MFNNDFLNYDQELNDLSKIIKNFVNKKDYNKCESYLCEAMCKYPHAPHPHNLYGIILEKKGKHPEAMKHFRAAWALDPTYSPALYNLNVYGTFFSKGSCAYDVDDVPNNWEKYL